MRKLNKKEFSEAHNVLWNQRNFLSLQEFSEEADILYSRFQMHIDDLIDHLQEIKNHKGNLKVLKEDFNFGTLHLLNVHVQQLNDSDSDSEWFVSIY